MRKTIAYSQNFLKDYNLVRHLIAKSGISNADIVIEIGAGKGIITSGLLERAQRVIAYELDKDLFNNLNQKFQNNPSIQLNLQDFLVTQLPKHPYKVFSNIPFNITSTIIKKLTLAENSPENTYLIVQKEAAMKFAGRPLDTKNSQLSVLLYPWFEFRDTYKFKSDDFSPRPNVEIILLEIKKREVPLVNNQNRDKYEDFVTYAFNQPKPNIKEGLGSVMEINTTNSKPSELNFEDWLSLFEKFLRIPEAKQIIVRGSFSKQLEQQENIEKINRTRTDKNWKQSRKG